jgi:hypothetical protein
MSQIHEFVTAHDYTCWCGQSSARVVCRQMFLGRRFARLDDSGLTMNYPPPAFATGGHSGPPQWTREIDPETVRETLPAGHNRVFQKSAE